MIIDKDFITLPFNRDGNLHEDYNIICGKIHIEVEERVKLSKMCKDLVKILKKKNVFSIYIVHPILHWGTAEVEKHYFDLETVEKIIFDDYYLVFEGEYFRHKIFYNAIFDFGEDKRW